MRLFGWLFGRRAFGEYPRRERMIFRYHDGTRNRLGDPLAIHRQLACVADLEETAKVAGVPTVEGVKAQGELAGIVRTAFGVPPFEQGGLLDSECLELFVRFGNFMKELEHDTRPLPSSATPSASQQVPAG